MTKDIITLQYPVTLRDFCIKKEITLILSLLWPFIAYTDTRLQKNELWVWKHEFLQLPQSVLVAATYTTCTHT